MKKHTSLPLLLAAFLVLFPLLAQAGGGNRGRLDRERLEVGRALIEVQSADVASIIPYYTDDIEYHDPIVDIYGIEAMTGFLFRLFGSSPDLVTTIEDETLDDGVYCATWTMVGQFAGVPYDAKGISIIKFRDRSAEVYYQRDYYTEGDIMAGIPGLDEAILGFRTYYRCAVDPTFDCPLPPPAALGGLEEAMALKHDRRGSDEPRHRRPSRGRLAREQLAIGRALVEINADNWQSLLPYYAPGYAYRDPIVTIDGFDTLVPFLGRLFANSPDLVTTVEDETVVDGIYMATWTMTGQFNGLPYSAPGMSIVKFTEDGLQVDYSRDYYTEGDIMASIPGLDEAVLGFRTFYRCAVDPTFDCPLPPPALSAPGAGLEKANAPRPGAGFSLGQNAPNPFNPSTEIAFVVPEGGANVTLRIYDLGGRLVRTLVDGHEPGGERTVTWFGRNDQGQAVSSGTYFYQLTGPSFTEIKKMTLLK